MKILFCQTQFKMGGQQKVLLSIAKELNKKHEVTVYYENHNFFDFEDLNIIKAKRSFQVLNFFLAILICSFTLKFDKKTIIDTWHLYNARDSLRKQKYDIVVLLNPYVLFVDEFRKFMVTKKIICWTHNLFEDYMFNRFKTEQSKLKLSMSHADKIISLEKYTASKWQEINRNTVVIHNPLTIENEVGYNNKNSKKIGMVTRIDINQKGLDILVKITKLLNPDIQIFIAGSGIKSEEIKFNNLLIENKLEKQIILLGSLKGEGLVKFYSSLGLLLVTSRNEGFPLVVAEAMSFGTHIIGFDIPSMREVTAEGQFGTLIPFDNTELFAKNIEDLQNRFLSKDFDLESEELVRYAGKLRVNKIIKEWEEALTK